MRNSRRVALAIINTIGSERQGSISVSRFSLQQVDIRYPILQGRYGQHQQPIVWKENNFLWHVKIWKYYSANKHCQVVTYYGSMPTVKGLDVDLPRIRQHLYLYFCSIPTKWSYKYQKIKQKLQNKKKTSNQLTHYTQIHIWT